MAEQVITAHASDAKGFLPGPLGLRLDEEAMPLTALHARASQLDAILPFGRMQKDGETTLLRLWPGTMWAIGELPDGQFRSVDITHGYTRFRLRGVEALHFLALYTSANVFEERIRQSRCLRTRIGDYDCTIMWTNTRDVQVFTDRSVAQSFVDHLRRLSVRHDPIDPLNQPNRVPPGAPERRG